MASTPSKKQAIQELREAFERNGFVRLQSRERLEEEGPRTYRKGTELRLTAGSEADSKRLVRLLKSLMFEPGRPFAKGLKFRVPLYSRDQVNLFLSMIGQPSVEQMEIEREAQAAASRSVGRSARRKSAKKKKSV